MTEKIRIGSRKSALARIQTELIANQLSLVYPELEIEIITKDTLGDRVLGSPLQSFGGKGVFVSEFEEALTLGRIDLAVHSAKDLPMELADGLELCAVSRREIPSDVLVLRRNRTPGDTFLVGTSSLRRQLELEEGWSWLKETLKLAEETRLKVKSLRGNVQTRLEKLAAGEFDAIVLAQAGLTRLGLSEDANVSFLPLNPEVFIPAGGQGIMAVEARAGSRGAQLCRRIDCVESRRCLDLERRILKELNAGCHEPVGVWSRMSETGMEVFGINRYQGVVKRIHLFGGNSEEEINRLAKEAGKGLR